MDLILDVDSILKRKIYDNFPLDPVVDKMDESNLDRVDDIKLTSEKNLLTEGIEPGKTTWFKHLWHSNSIALDSVHRKAKESLSDDNNLESALKEALDLAIEQEIRTVLQFMAYGLADLIIHVISECGYHRVYTIQSRPSEPKPPIDRPHETVEHLGTLYNGGFYVTLTMMTQWWDVVIETKTLCGITVL